jgi:hypothetical protein
MVENKDNMIWEYGSIFRNYNNYAQPICYYKIKNNTLLFPIAKKPTYVYLRHIDVKLNGFKTFLA